MKSLFLTFISIVFILDITGCKKENNNRETSTYEIDSILFNLYDTSGVVTYTYTFQPNDDGVFASISRNNDTITYVSKYDAGIDPFNSNSTVQVKGNRIFKTSYIQPIGIFGQDGGTFHEYYYYNTNNKLDSIIHITSGNFDGIPFDTTSETFHFVYENDNLISHSYSIFLNQKNLIGLDINEFLEFGLFIHYNNSDGFVNGMKDDIKEFPKNCIMNNLNSFNSNSKYLIDSLYSIYPINYTFDASNNNRIKDITVFNGIKKYYYYKFYYKN